MKHSHQVRGNLFLAAAISIAVAGPFAIRSRAQEAAKPPVAFEVASLKPSQPGVQGGMIRPTVGNGGYMAANMTLRTLIRIAYSVPEQRISGGPSWVDTDRFDMDAKAEHQSTPDELHEMLKTLITERFHLKIHPEAKERTVFALLVDKGGPKMAVHPEGDKDNGPITGGGLGPRTAKNATMGYFALYLSGFLDRAVIDKTGLTGHYDFVLTYVPDRPAGVVVEGHPQEPPPDGPNIQTALRDQLGLRLETQKGTEQVLIIDHVEKLTEN